MVIVSEGMFNKAIREYARYALPSKEVLTYYGVGDERIGMKGTKCWLEDEVVRKMSTGEGHGEG